MKINLIKLSFIIKFLIFFILLLTEINQANSILLNKIIGIVNNRAILLSDFNNMKKSFQEHFQKKEINENLIKNQIISNLILYQFFLYILEYKTDLHNIDNEFKDQLDIEKLNIMKERLNSVTDIDSYSKLINQDYKTLLEKNLELVSISNKDVFDFLSISPQEIESNFNQHETNIQKYFNIDYISITIINKKNQNEKYKKNFFILKTLNKLKKNNNMLEIYNYYKNSLRIDKKFTVIENVPNFSLKILQASKRKKNVIGPIKIGAKSYIINITHIYKNCTPNIKLRIKHILLRHSYFEESIRTYKKLLKIYNYTNNNKLSFENLAKIYSQDFFSSFETGDLGWNSEEQINAIFNNQPPLFKIQDSNNIIKSSLGWHFIQSIEKKITYEIDENKKFYLSQILLNQKFFEMINNWKQIERNDVYIKIIKDSIIIS